MMKFPSLLLSLAILGSTSQSGAAMSSVLDVATESELIGRRTQAVGGYKSPFVGACRDSYEVTIAGCDWPKLKQGIKLQIDDQYYSRPKCRGIKPDDEVRAIMGNETMTEADFAAHIRTVCINEFKKLSYFKGFTLDEIFGEEEGEPIDFFNGRGPINSRRETSATKFGNKVDSINEGTGLKFKNIEENYNNKYPFHWPGEGSNKPLPNFDQCKYNTVMCCWSQDRTASTSATAGVATGNCKAPFDKNCRDADPKDNTDICLVNMADSPASAHGKQFGFSVFPGDDPSDDDSEGAMNCHGFSWADDDMELSKLYRANNLFHIAMYGVHENGYVSAVPGAPQCGCLEQMPIVSRADCTEVKTSDFQLTFTLEHGELTMKIKESTVEFTPCAGNDLQSHYNKLAKDKKFTTDYTKNVGHRLVGTGGCPKAIDQFFVKLFIGGSEATNDEGDTE